VSICGVIFGNLEICHYIWDKYPIMSKPKKYSKSGQLTGGFKEPAVALYHSPSETASSTSLLSRVLSILDITPGSATPAREDVNLINLIRTGVQKHSLENLMHITGFTAIEMAALVRTTDRTLRRYSSTEVLQPDISERIVEIARLYSRGEEVFGSLNNFKTWMNSPVMALGNKKPRDFLDTSIGIEVLTEELGRIEHGIFA
jgi:putative toxin-antitoxin system antitoxin component (TIGR02293 family)